MAARGLLSLHVEMEMSCFRRSRRCPQAIPKRDHGKPTFATYGDAEDGLPEGPKVPNQRESTESMVLSHAEIPKMYFRRSRRGIRLRWDRVWRIRLAFNCGKFYLLLSYNRAFPAHFFSFIERLKTRRRPRRKGKIGAVSTLPLGEGVRERVVFIA